MVGPLRFSSLATAALWLASATPAFSGGIYWGVDVFDTPNLPGFKTYDLTLKTTDGAPMVVSFDSSLGKGITGPLNQSARRPGGKSQLFGGGNDPSNLADSRFLFTPGDGHLTIGNLVDSDSLLSMTWGAFNYAIDPMTREMPFARLVTNDPASVRLNGSVHTFQGGGSTGGAYPIDFTLDRVFDFTSPPPPPVIPAAPVTPVAYDSPPVFVTPEVPSPVVVAPPVFVAPASPPGPVSGAIYWGVNSFETPGLPGFTTYEVTMKSAAGAILSMAFDPAIGGGISGPLHQAPGDSVIFEGGADAGNLADSRFLLTPTEANLVFNSAESASGMQTVFGTYGDRLDPSAVEVPFARFVTDRPNDVLISGNVGTVLPWGGTIQNAINLSLNDMLALTSPLEIPNDPYAPPPPPPTAVVRPPVVEAPPVDESYYPDPFIDTTYSAPPPTPNPVEPVLVPTAPQLPNDPYVPLAERLQEYIGSPQDLPSSGADPQNEVANLVAEEIARLVAEGRPWESITVQELQQNLGIAIDPLPLMESEVVTEATTLPQPIFPRSPFVLIPTTPEMLAEWELNGRQVIDPPSFVWTHGSQYLNWACDTVPNLQVIRVVEGSSETFLYSTGATSETLLLNAASVPGHSGFEDGSASAALSVVPEPASAALVLAATAGWGLRRRR